MTRSLRLATRGSPLARAQAATVATRLRQVGVDATLVVVETEGDRRGDVPIAELAGRGAFTKEIQSAVLDGRADVAVHSAKDLPSATPEGLALAAVPDRADPADALVGSPLLVLGPGATVATGAPRRRALLLAERPDLHVVSLRGNISTRLASVDRDGIRAVVVAAAALIRLGLTDRISERLDPDRFVPQVGQGAIALECQTDSSTEALLAQIDDEALHRCLDAERAFLSELGLGCDLPGGALATDNHGVITVRGVLLSDDGATVARGIESDADPARAGRELAANLQRAFGVGIEPP